MTASGFLWGLLVVAVLAVVAQRGLRFLEALGQRPAHPAGAGELAAGAASGAKHQAVRDVPEAAQAVYALGHQVDLVIAADLADRCLPVRVGVEERVARVAAGERLAGPQVLG